jgi:MFS family permease
LLVGGLFAGVILCQVPLAWLADRLGRLYVLLACHGLLLASLFSVHRGPGTLLLAVSLFVLGMCCGALYPLGLALLGDRVPAAELSRANAFYLASNCAGSLSGPVLSGLVIGRFGEPAQFLAGIAAVLAVLTLNASLKMKGRVPTQLPRLAATRRGARLRFAKRKPRSTARRG